MNVPERMIQVMEPIAIVAMGFGFVRYSMAKKVFSFPVIIEKNCCRPFVFSFLTRTHDFKNPFNPFVEVDVYKSAINFPIFKPLLINSDFV
jgi:hypothetical protein